MIKGRDVRNLTIPQNARVITDSERTLNKENTNQDSQDKTDNTSPDKTGNTSQDSPENTSQESQGKTDNTNPENRDRTVSIKIRKEIHKQNLPIKRILIYLSGISRMSHPLDLQAEISNNQGNLPHNLREASRNPNPESSKPNRSLSRSQQQRVMMVQEEEGLFDAVEGRLQLKKEERND